MSPDPFGFGVVERWLNDSVFILFGDGGLGLVIRGFSALCCVRFVQIGGINLCFFILIFGSLFFVFNFIGVRGPVLVMSFKGLKKSTFDFSPHLAID